MPGWFNLERIFRSTEDDMAKSITEQLAAAETINSRDSSLLRGMVSAETLPAPSAEQLRERLASRPNDSVAQAMSRATDLLLRDSFDYNRGGNVNIGSQGFTLGIGGGGIYGSRSEAGPVGATGEPGPVGAQGTPGAGGGSWDPAAAFSSSILNATADNISVNDLVRLLLQVLQQAEMVMFHQLRADDVIIREFAPGRVHRQGREIAAIVVRNAVAGYVRVGATDVRSDTKTAAVVTMPHIDTAASSRRLLPDIPSKER